MVVSSYIFLQNSVHMETLVHLCTCDRGMKWNFFFFSQTFCIFTCLGTPSVSGHLILATIFREKVAKVILQQNGKHKKLLFFMNFSVFET